ncbi:MAG TPA: outer membrane lipoprotein carrier protein LolA [Polyangia bacterium]
MKLLRVLLAAGLILSARPALAATWYENWASIRKAAASIKSIETAFVQTRTLKILTKPLVSRGVMDFRRPNDLRWEYQSPLETLLVAKGGNIHRLIKHGATWVADVSGRMEAMKIVLGEINLWLDGDFSSSKTFRPVLRPARAGQAAHVELIPIDPSLGKIISRITIGFGERPGTVSAIDIFEEGEGVTHIVFENSRLDQTIPDQRFEPPR